MKVSFEGNWLSLVKFRWYFIFILPLYNAYLRAAFFTVATKRYIATAS